MNNKEFVLETMESLGLSLATNLQASADEMTGTELYEAEDYIPDFAEAVKRKNMLERSIGFTCKSSAGRVVRLIQPYDSDIYTGEPEEYPALWGFKWSKDPRKALPFIALSTSPYMIDDCCLDNNEAYASTIDNNVYAPHDYPQGWKKCEQEND